MKGGSFMMWKKVISMLLVAAMLAMPIGCGKDGNKDKDTTSGVETTDIGDDSAETAKNTGTKGGQRNQRIR